ncbi:MAG: (Fe-S)-binding protein [Clostridium sp.]
MKGNIIVKSHQISSNLGFFTGDYIPDKCETVFFPGCSLSGYNSDIVEKTFSYLSGKIENLGLLVACCSKPSQEIKDTKRYNQMENTLKQTLESNGIGTVITACSNCYMMFKKNYNIRVLSLWEVIADVIGDDFKNKGEGIDLNIALHDPCPIRRESHIHESIRKILNKSGFKFEEFSNCRDKTICCGASGMMMAKNPELAKKLMTKRASSTEATRIVSYCESCVQSMLIGGKESLHILDLLFNNNVTTKKETTQRISSLKEHWVQRRKTAKIPKVLR